MACLICLSGLVTGSHFKIVNPSIHIHYISFQILYYTDFQIRSVSGRKRGKEWSKVIVDGDSISCCHCHELLSKKIERIRNHLSKCHQYKKSQESKNNHQNSLEVEVEVAEEFMPSPSSSYRVADEPVRRASESTSRKFCRGLAYTI